MTTRELDLAQHVARLQDRCRQLEAELAATEDALTESQVELQRTAAWGSDLFLRVDALAREGADRYPDVVKVSELRIALGLEP